MRAASDLGGPAPLRAFGHLASVGVDLAAGQHLNPLCQGCARDGQARVLFHERADCSSEYRGVSVAQAVGHAVEEAIPIAGLPYHFRTCRRQGPFRLRGGCTAACAGGRPCAAPARARRGGAARQRPAEGALRRLDVVGPSVLRECLHQLLVLGRSKAAGSQCFEYFHRLGSCHLRLPRLRPHGPVQAVGHREARERHAAVAEAVRAMQQAPFSSNKRFGDVGDHRLEVPQRVVPSGYHDRCIDPLGQAQSFQRRGMPRLRRRGRRQGTAPQPRKRRWAWEGLPKALLLMLLMLGSLLGAAAFCLTPAVEQPKQHQTAMRTALCVCNLLDLHNRYFFLPAQAWIFAVCTAAQGAELVLDLFEHLRLRVAQLAQTKAQSQSLSCLNLSSRERRQGPTAVEESGCGLRQRRALRQLGRSRSGLAPPKVGAIGVPGLGCTLHLLAQQLRVLLEPLRFGLRRSSREELPDSVDVDTRAFLLVFSLAQVVGDPVTFLAEALNRGIEVLSLCSL
mmetsp:Transcript_70698/g.199567  ORF Transcript_70698/g.199567 Transcript_70698/m.199567 type:complete len:508 (-) Transcript_70698:472-1995(-)